MAPRAAEFFSRALGMLFAPGRTWDRIAGDLTAPGALMRGYVAPLAAVAAVCGVAGALAFGFNIANVGVRMSVPGLLLGAAVGYVATLASVWLAALFVDLAAPAFGGRRDGAAAMNLIAYGATASWVAGVAGIYPSLSIPVGILAGLYSGYAIWLGLPKLMRVADDQRLTAFAAVLIAILLLAAGRATLASMAAELGGPLSASYAPR
ncbi:Yip1 family protein [Phenylobacterium sp.]|uniref:Yip1 family protein n=1 Tax=Phenylobacterium sp. TaxID=1871053 RepID=UPI0025CFD3A2|nr:Yip1 family protein [Phenylobacterium sp.]MBX3482274.1 YIP1 family protein [Phenylobacterium sp.]MCW5761163.1 YIP1 family protein [Phenylobacterium sp.]